MPGIIFFIFIAGIFQIILVLGSLAIPKLLSWKSELSKVSDLIRQIFWTYAGYILCMNLCFGLLSALAPSSLCDGSFLARVITLFITVYWATRVAIQFFYFDRKNTPKGWIYVWGEIALVALFIFLTVVYGFAFFSNISMPDEKFPS
ncbi:MAG: hypothetical protein ACJ75J_03235 [Cytophagaceae bacterium]